MISFNFLVRAIRRVQARLIVLLFTVASGMASARLQADPGSESVTVLKFHEIVYVRSGFSAEEDLLVKVGKGTNRQVSFRSAALIPRDTPMVVESLEEAQAVFHPTGDDVAPWHLNGTYIGGNHGASEVIRVSASSHGLTQGDLGSAWEDGAGVVFYLIGFEQESGVLFLSENSGEPPLWKFVREMTGPSLTRRGTKTVLSIEKTALTQLWPACRITEQRYLVDGNTSLEEMKATECRFLEIVEGYDIVAPDAVLKAVKEAPGHPVDFVAADLEAVVHNQIRYRFASQGACTIRHEATALREFQLDYMGFIQSTPLKGAPSERLEYYLPKTVPFTVEGKTYDFQRVQTFSKPPVPLVFSAVRGNLSDPMDLPDRFIQFLGQGEGENRVRRVGFAMGYSLCEGITPAAIRAENTVSPLFIFTTGKIYPKAIDSRAKRFKAGRVRVGEKLECLAYRQYFNPSAHPCATAVYGHWQEDDYFLYADFHRPGESVLLSVPTVLEGASFEVVEKTDSIILDTKGIVPPGGLPVSVRGDYGRVIVKISLRKAAIKRIERTPGPGIVLHP
ncbi:MAG TPA: hypothetical protein VNQ90_12970 [Chthoniobacteraceae bacterium]|nr:hypothetical protein [Chthoniobacteraceae bacterium]